MRVNIITLKYVLHRMVRGLFQNKGPSGPRLAAQSQWIPYHSRICRFSGPSGCFMCLWFIKILNIHNIYIYIIRVRVYNFPVDVTHSINFVRRAYIYIFSIGPITTRVGNYYVYQIFFSINICKINLNNFNIF